ncbi:unnamed protein product [Dicrocoelium dendriticum]|nr:unnamed protein product [Dicrocoelium dendriticum]
MFSSSSYRWILLVLMMELISSVPTIPKRPNTNHPPSGWEERNNLRLAIPTEDAPTPLYARRIYDDPYEASEVERVMELARVPDEYTTIVDYEGEPDYPDLAEIATVKDIDSDQHLRVPWDDSDSYLSRFGNVDPILPPPNVAFVED